MKKDNDIVAPDGYLLGGFRRVRKDGTILFHRMYWKCPEEWIGLRTCVHVTDPICLNNIEAAPPELHYFDCHYKDRVVLYPADKPDAKSLFRSHRGV